MDHVDPTEMTARRRWALPAGIAVVAAAAAGGGLIASGAFFTSGATVPGATLGTATIEISADTAATSAPISAAGLLPGDTASTTIDLENSGSAGIYYSVTLPTTAGDEELEDELDVTVEIGDVSETRTLTAWQAGVLQLGDELAADGSAEVTVTVELPDGAPNSIQGTDAGFEVRFDAIQSRNTPEPTEGWIAD